MRPEPCSGRAAQGVTQGLKRASLRSRSSLMSTGDIMNLLGEGASRATRNRTLEAAHFNLENDSLLQAGAFCQVAEIGSMNTVAPQPTSRAWCAAHGTTGLNL